jgi:hypothetical protein
LVEGRFDTGVLHTLQSHLEMLHGEIADLHGLCIGNPAPILSTRLCKLSETWRRVRSRARMLRADRYVAFSSGVVAQGR